MGAVMALAARVKEQKRRTSEALAKLGAPPGLWFTPAGAAPSYQEPNRIEVRIWRIGPGELDNDGPDDALKNVRDAVARWLGIDDRDGGGALWHRGAQEKTAGTSTQGPCSVCFALAGRPCHGIATHAAGADRMVKGLHVARRTPWRVRVEVRDLSPGPDRVLVLASVEPQKRKKAKPRLKPIVVAEGSEEHSARMLVGCDDCGVAVGVRCRATGRRLWGCHIARLTAAGVKVTASEMSKRREIEAARAAKGSRRIVGPPVVRVALPWAQPSCRVCGGSSVVPVGCGTTHVGPCAVCNGRGIVGPLALSIDPAVDAHAASVTYRVPAGYVARWGAVVTLHPRRYRLPGVGVAVVFELKGPKVM